MSLFAFQIFCHISGTWFQVQPYLGVPPCPVRIWCGGGGEDEKNPAGTVPIGSRSNPAVFRSAFQQWLDTTTRETGSFSGVPLGNYYIWTCHGIAAALVLVKVQSCCSRNRSLIYCSFMILNQIPICIMSSILVMLGLKSPSPPSKVPLQRRFIVYWNFWLQTAFVVTCCGDGDVCCLHDLGKISRTSWTARVPLSRLSALPPNVFFGNLKCQSQSSVWVFSRQLPLII